MQTEIRNELSPRELRELQESLAFTLLWKVALFFLVFSIEIVILMHIPATATVVMKIVTYFVLLLTILTLHMSLMVESRTIRKHAGILCIIGIAAIIVGLLNGTFVIG